MVAIDQLSGEEVVLGRLRLGGMNFLNSPVFFPDSENSNNHTVGIRFEKLYQAGLLV